MLESIPDLRCCPSKRLSSSTCSATWHPQCNTGTWNSADLAAQQLVSFPSNNQVLYLSHICRWAEQSYRWSYKLLAANVGPWGGVLHGTVAISWSTTVSKSSCLPTVIMIITRYTPQHLLYMQWSQDYKKESSPSSSWGNFHYNVFTNVKSGWSAPITSIKPGCTVYSWLSCNGILCMPIHSNLVYLLFKYLFHLKRETKYVIHSYNIYS